MTTNGNSTASEVTAKIGEAVNGALNGAVNGAKSASIYTIPAQIGGKEVELSDTFDVISPSTGKLLHRCSSASIRDAINAVEVAQAAFPSWRDTRPGEKREIFLRTAEVVKRRAEELGKYMMEEPGSGHFFAETFNVGLAADILIDIAGRISGLVGLVPTTADKGTSAMVWKEPYGVILGIAPW